MADSATGTEEGEKKTCVFIKKSRQRSAVRKRRRSSGEDDEDSDEESAVVRKERKPSKGPLYQRTSAQTDNKSKAAFGEGDSGEEGEGKGREDVTWTYRSKRTAETEGPKDMGATVTVDKKENKKEAEKKANRYGPIRAPQFLRSTVRWDYQPDICKDYKETGYCGFGDSCKFLHDRGDYKAGWQLDKEFEENMYGKEDMAQYEVSDSDDEDLPFACYICREQFKNPVITRCKHYFCESCAIKQYKKSSRCAVCSQQTGGVFNPAKDIIAKLKKLEQEQRENFNEEPDED